MKHPVEGDFATTVTEAGVTVTFRPTNSIYSFYRLADSNEIGRLGPVSPARVQHAGPSGDTGDYAQDEVQDMATRIAAEVAASLSQIHDEEETERLATVRPPSVLSDEGD
jgi:hypothetical protein